MVWYPSHRDVPPPFDENAAGPPHRRVVAGVADRSDCHGPYSDHIRRSLLVLRALTHEDTGGIVAAATTRCRRRSAVSRNWDYRYAGCAMRR